MARLVLQAAALGTASLAGAYQTANTMPTSLYTLMVGGALNSVLVPQLVRARAEHPDGGRAHEQRLVTMVLSVLALGTVAAVVFAPQLVALYMSSSAPTFGLTVLFARLLLPQIFFYGCFFMFGQVLNARGRLGAMGWAPVLNNVVLIGLFGFCLQFGSTARTGRIPGWEVLLLGAVTTAGIAVQAACLVLASVRSGFGWRPRFDWRGSGLRGSLVAARWTLLFVLVNQVALAVVTRYANAADAQLRNAGAGNSAYFFAQNIWMLPQSIVTVSLVTAVLPRMTRAVSEHRLDDVREDLSRGLRLTGLLIVPAAFFFLVFGPEIAVVMFAHGNGTAGTAAPLGEMLRAFALGLIPFSAQYLLLRGFYAFDDTRTPFWMALWISVADIVLATACHLWLPPRWAVTGMAAAYAVSYLFGMVVTAVRLRRRLERRLDGKRLVRTYGKLVVAAGAAGAVGWGAAHVLQGPVLLGLVAGGAAMALSFVVLGKALRIREFAGLRALRAMRAAA
ncbi:murein biosynthesis integral membrane protein MurJ [Streptacidiphilus fuscans]